MFSATNKIITIIGAGLAGSETAWQVAQAIEQYQLPYKIKLYEMRPKVKTPVHHTDNFAELVCSNSLGSEFLTTARGLLLHEMEYFNSLIISSAKIAKVPAGQALAVDRDLFTETVTTALSKNSHIEVIREEFTEDLTKYLNHNDYIVIASGPLTTKPLAASIQGLLAKANPEANSSYLHFFDAAAPIVSADSINMDIAFKASRYNKQAEGSEGDYINCPFYSWEEFDKFYEALLSAERAPLKDFEKESMRYFEACMPVEAIAERGKKTLTFGPLKPVGLRDPRNLERKPVAVVQLRQDNVVASLYNLVGFQTNLKWGEQKRVFSMIPGLENLEIVRYGVMHQNIFINSPLFLNPDMSLRASPNIYFAGQITGVEGYSESAASGIITARSLINKITSKEKFELPRETMMGALAHYISHADPKHFQPINSNWGILNSNPEALELKYRKDKRLKQEYFVQRSLSLLK